MRYERAAPMLAMVAAFLGGTPALGAIHGADAIWVELCDPAHSGRRIPLPLRKDREAPLTGCHAACALMPERQKRR